MRLDRRGESRHLHMTYGQKLKKIPKFWLRNGEIKLRATMSIAYWDRRRV